MLGMSVVVLVAACGGLVGARPADTDQDNLVDSRSASDDGIVREVEEALAKLGPTAPRLTRGEILALAEEVRSRKQKALVVVMPLSTNGSTSLEQLFTQAPVTQVFGELPTTSRPPMKRRRRPSPRPVYVPSTSTLGTSLASSTPLSSLSTASLQVSQTTSMPSPQFTTPRPQQTRPPIRITTVQWKPLEELEVPEGMREPLVGLSVKPETKPVYVTLAIPTRTTSKPSIPPQDMSVAAESLSDEMKDLLATFGLLGQEKEEPKAPAMPPQDPVDTGLDFSAEKPKVDPSSYLGFKPLPVSSSPEKDDGMTADMKSFLASFGLYNDRSGKSMKNEVKAPKKDDASRQGSRENRVMREVPIINTEMFSDDMKSVLSDLGILGADGERKGKRLGEHVFNPTQHAASLNTTDQLTRIQNLLTKIKQLSRNNKINHLSPAELKELLKPEADLLEVGEDGNVLLKRDENLSDLNAPDPLSLQEILEMYEKNEIKRQESNMTLNMEEATVKSTSRMDNADDIEYIETDHPSAEEPTTTQASPDMDHTPAESMTTVVTSESNVSSKNVVSDSDVAAATDSESQDSSSSSGSSASSASSSATAVSNDGTAVASASASASGGEASSSASAASDTSSSSASSSTGTSSTDSDSAGEAAESPSFDDLNDSFGGEITTTGRPNGFYFLLDWNSFLQVGMDERKVDLNFNPKIGNPRNFYPIKFP